MSQPRYVKRAVGEVVNATPPGAMNTFLTVADINADGLLDIVVSGRNGRMVWLENRGLDQAWPEHLIDELDGMECGGSAHDLTGNGYPDLINGGDFRRDAIYWWENPGPSGGSWKRRVIAGTGHTQFHDTLIADLTGDGRTSLAFTNQHASGGTTIYCVPLPRDPTVSPWPGLQVVASGRAEPNPFRPAGAQPDEGLAVGDLDGDGRNELVCGTHWYTHTENGWESHRFAAGFITTKVAIGDIDGDGRNEILLAEGDPCVYGQTQGGKLAWFRPQGDITALWEEHVIEDSLLDAHTLQVGDLCGNGRLDLLVGEVGMVDQQADVYIGRPPRLIVYESDGQGGFTPGVIDEGTGIHDAVLADMNNQGVLDIVGKPLHGPEKWRIHVYYRDR